MRLHQAHTSYIFIVTKFVLEMLMQNYDQTNIVIMAHGIADLNIDCFEQKIRNSIAKEHRPQSDRGLWYRQTFTHKFRIRFDSLYIKLFLPPQ